MHEQQQQPLNSAAIQSQRRRKNPIKKKQKLEFSKQLTMIDICCWVIITLLILIIMLVQPTLAESCINIFGGATAAYVSLRLGYTAKAGVENYKKISASYRNVNNNNDYEYYYFDEENSNG